MATNTNTAYDLRFLEAMDGDRPDTIEVESLADGEYDVIVQEAHFKPPTATKSMVIIEMKVEVESAGKHQGDKVKYALFIKDKDSRDRVLRDLGKLGFDCAEWTVANGRPISGELQKVHRVLKRLRMKVKKSTSKSDEGKVYHNLNVVKRILTDGKPPVLGAEQLNAVPEHSDDDPFPD